MFVKSLLAGALALTLNPPQQEVGTNKTFTHNPYVELLTCDKGRGTGFKLDNGTWVSAHHVTSMGGCKLDGLSIIVTDFDERKDYSTFTVPGDRRAGGLKADCSGYRPGWYFGTGHAKALPFLTSLPVLFTNALNQGGHPRGWAILFYNRFIPGQSGGPVSNPGGAVTGIVNAFAYFFHGSFSIALKDTPICAK